MSNSSNWNDHRKIEMYQMYQMRDGRNECPKHLRYSFPFMFNMTVLYVLCEFLYWEQTRKTWFVIPDTENIYVFNYWFIDESESAADLLYQSNESIWDFNSLSSSILCLLLIRLKSIYHFSGIVFFLFLFFISLSRCWLFAVPGTW